MTREQRQLFDEARKLREDEGEAVVRTAVRAALNQVVEELNRETEKLRHCCEQCRLNGSSH